MWVRVRVRMWFTGEGNDKALQHFCLENPVNSVKRQKDKTLKDELPRWVGAQYVTGDQWRNTSRKNKGIEPKQKQHTVVDGTGDKSKVGCYQEQCCIGTWNVKSESRQIGSDQTGDDKGEYRHSRNQQTKLDWNG